MDVRAHGRAPDQAAAAASLLLVLVLLLLAVVAQRGDAAPGVPPQQRRNGGRGPRSSRGEAALRHLGVFLVCSNPGAAAAARLMYMEDGLAQLAILKGGRLERLCVVCGKEGEAGVWQGGGDFVLVVGPIPLSLPLRSSSGDGQERPPLFRDRQSPSRPSDARRTKKAP